jgi:hypothetical protein
MFYNIGHWSNCYNTFYSCNLQMFGVSYRVFTCQAFPT